LEMQYDTGGEFEVLDFIQQHSLDGVAPWRTNCAIIPGL
jgi:hypothetical protein